MTHRTFTPTVQGQRGFVQAKHLQGYGFMRLLYALGLVALLSGSGLAQGCIPAEAPAVIWDVQASTGQVGWGGLSNPTTNRFPPQTWSSVTSTPTGHSASGVASWGTKWSYVHSGQPSSAELSVSLDGAGLFTRHDVTAHWWSQFLMEDAWASVNQSLWVRGGLGTAVEIAIAGAGGGYGTRKNYTASVGANGASASFPGSTGGSFSLTTGNPSAFTLYYTANQTRIFDEYPGVIYSRVSLPGSSASFHAGQSCIMLCPGSFIGGSAWLETYLQARLPQGSPPEILSIVAFPEGAAGDWTVVTSGGMVQVPANVPMRLSIMARDPDDGTMPGAGIVGYRISSSNGPVGSGLGAVCTDDSVIFSVPMGVTLSFTVVAIDNEGFSSEPRTAHFHAPPILPLPYPLPGHAPGTESVPVLSASGGLDQGTLTLVLHGAAAGTAGGLVVGQTLWSQPFLGGIVHPTPDLLLPFWTDYQGEALFTLPGSVPGLEPLLVQAWIVPSTGTGVSSTNAVLVLQ